ncbi:MAG: response regulator [Bacteroidota bacterium]
MTYKCIIIDDSSVHRLAISFLVKNHPRLELVGAYSNPFDGIEMVFKNKVDIVFLDVLLEDFDAFELLDKIEIPAEIILNSSWEKLLTKAKDYNVKGLLLKPMRKDKFEVAVEKVLKFLDVESRSACSGRKPYLVQNPNVFQV